LQQGADGKPVVWAVREGKAVPVPVEHGPLGSESVDVRGGLRAGDWVVAAGGHLLREGEEVVPVDRATGRWPRPPPSRRRTEPCAASTSPSGRCTTAAWCCTR